MTEEATEPTTSGPQVVGGIKKKQLAIIAIVAAVVWAFTISTGSTVLLIIVGVLTAVVAAGLIYVFRMIAKQRRLVSVLQQGNQSPEARRAALAKLEAGKDASSPTNLFARAQLLAQEDPKGALKLLDAVELKAYPAAMQDDVSLLKAQLYLSQGRTQDARKAADSMNLENPARKEVRAFAASIVAEAWARTGKSKEAIALLDTIELPKENREAVALQCKVARVFARFAANQRNQARTELVALADEDPNILGRFVMPQFRVHPELQKLARSVIQNHPSSRRMIKTQATKQR